MDSTHANVSTMWHNVIAQLIISLR